jgi:hypothetical protein
MHAITNQRTQTSERYSYLDKQWMTLIWTVEELTSVRLERRCLVIKNVF